MTIKTQLQLIGEVRGNVLRRLIVGASKVLSEGFWEQWPKGKIHQPLWARMIWRMRGMLPRRLWN